MLVISVRWRWYSSNRHLRVRVPNMFYYWNKVLFPEKWLYIHKFASECEEWLVKFNSYMYPWKCVHPPHWSPLKISAATICMAGDQYVWDIHITWHATRNCCLGADGLISTTNWNLNPSGHRYNIPWEDRETFLWIGQLLWRKRQRNSLAFDWFARPCCFVTQTFLVALCTYTDVVSLVPEIDLPGHQRREA